MDSFSGPLRNVSHAEQMAVASNGMLKAIDQTFS